MYIQFNCDIILNDEVFDEKGIPSGGDGTYYNWAGINNASGAYIEGNNHTVYGLYIDNAAGNRIGLFSNNSNAVKEIKNLNITNAYVSGQKEMSAFAYRVERMENCKLLSGVVKSLSSYTAGLSYRINTAENCKNYANIIGNSYVAGISVMVIEAKNCQNFGKITNLSGNYVGGLFQVCSSEISNCKNLGNIYSAGTFGVGGLIAQVSAPINLNNCINYGDVITAAGTPCGFIGVVETNEWISIINCKNYGVIKNEKGGAGLQATNRYLQDKFKVVMKDCEFYNTSVNSQILSATNSEILMSNIKISYKNINNQVALFSGDGMNLEVNGMQVSANINGGRIYFFGNFNQKVGTKAKLNNIFFKLSGIQIQTSYLVSVKPWLPYEYIINGFVVSDMTDSKNYYYGTNFSGFYFSWKTGQIGQIVFDGRGSFQGTIDEEWLIRNGYEKKEI